MNQTLDLDKVEKKASTYLDDLIEQRDELNERKAKMKGEIREREIVKPSFFQRMKTNTKKKRYLYWSKMNMVKMKHVNQKRSEK